MRPIQVFNIATLVLLLLALFSGPALAQTPQPPSDDAVNAVAKELYCPVCENVPLDVCPTTACAQWRELIRLKLSEGWDKEQIKQYFRLQYGERVLDQPPLEGWFNVAFLVLIVLAVVVGVFVVYRVLRGSRAARKAAAGSAAPPPADDPYIRRLEEELKKRK